MGNDELLSAISDMMDEKFEAFGDQLDKRFDSFSEHMDEKFDFVNKRLDFIAFKENRIGKQLIDLNLDIQIAERGIRKDIRHINDTLETLIEMLRTHNPIPQ